MRRLLGLLDVAAVGVLAVAVGAAGAAEQAAGPRLDGDRWAVVIGISDCQDLGKLATPRNDAKAVAKVLTESGGFAENRVILLTDDAEPQNRPTLATIRKRIEGVAALTEPQDTLIVFFSGHGVTVGGKGYLVPVDGDAKNAVPLDWVKETLAKAKAAAKVLILDTCHAGSAAEGVGGIAPSMVAGTTGLVMILSSAADQVSYPDEASGRSVYPDETGVRSVFSKYLAEGLSGAADADGDRRITQAELFDFVRRRMTDWSLKTGKTQKAVALPEGAGGMVLALISDVPTLLVKAVDATTGDEIAGAEVYIDGRKVGTVPLAGYRLDKGSSVVVEVRGDRLTPYTETVAVTRGGPHTITARLERITIRVPPGFRAKAGTQREPYSNTGWAKEIVQEATGMEMVFIPAGEFLMGSPAAEAQRGNDETQHRVGITKPFYMGKYEVTQGEWQKVMGDNPSRFKGSGRLPVEKVSWDDCQTFLGKGGTGLRLPTEAEWEYACRAGTTTPFNTGETIGTDQANYDGNYTYGSGRKGEYRQKTVEVGSFRPNAWGLYDMHGNVWEWCADWYGNYPSGTVTNPTGPASGQARVLRGGSWFFNPWNCRSGYRNRISPDFRNIIFGFRVVVPLAGVDLP